MKDKFTYILAFALLVTSCSQEQPLNAVDNNEKSDLILTTRAGTATDDFEDDSELRLAIFDSGTATPYVIENNNFIYAKKLDSKWQFSFNEGRSMSNSLGFVQNDTAKVDIVGVYPYITDSVLTKVAIDQNTQKPFMWAKSASLSLANDVVSTQLDFKHIMSALYFDMKLKNSANAVTLTHIKIKLYDNADHLKPELPYSATIDFTNGGTLTINDKRSEIRVLPP